VQPVEKLSVAMQVATVVQTASHEFRIPIITSDSSAAWTPEGQEITPSNPGVDEITVTPKKLAALTILSNELANDSTPDAANVVGESIARDLARKLDSAFFGDSVANGPNGIESLVAYQFVDTDATPLTSVDAFSEAISLAENEGATVTAFVANAKTVLALSKLKKLSNNTSNEPLLTPDPTLPTRRQILGVGLYSVPNAVLADNVVWAFDKSRVFIVMREDATLVLDASAYFSSDRLGIRSTIRVSWGFPHQASMVRIAAEPGS
jgi:HK97 family phage major capsid protein